MTGVLALVVVSWWLGWHTRGLVADIAEDRAWWAARPHIAGIECPLEAECSICTAGAP